MPTPTERLAAAQARIETTRATRYRLESDHERAVEAQAAAAERLRTEFGVATPEEARAKLAELNATVEANLAAVEQELERIEQ